MLRRYIFVAKYTLGNSINGLGGNLQRCLELFGERLVFVC